MDRHAKVSVIVPAYNVEDTLFDCIASLVMQTLNDIEIIIVNDCSTDHTYMVMQMLEEKFPDKIIIIDSPVNRGPGGARNLGMEYASGDYIGFVDSDDYVAKDMYEKLYNEA
ncbi:MAG: glycosyltransferase, partial [Lachnospiraceae bacterium]|nr:glycosyltransferase [Lachnospiraceae bacterium]